MKTAKVSERAALAKRLRNETNCMQPPPPWAYPAWAACIVVFNLAGLLLINLTGTLILVVLGAMMAGIAQLHAGSLGHDFSHGALGTRRHMRQLWEVLCFNLGLGYSAALWHHEHDLGHHPNGQGRGRDPNLEAGSSILVLHEGNVRGRSGLPGLLARNQHCWLLPSMALLQGLRLLQESLRFVLTAKADWTERGLLASHLILWWVLPCLNLGVVSGTASFALVKLFSGAAFFFIVVNHHVGMPTIPDDGSPAHLRAQVEVTRDVTAGGCLSWLSAGLVHHVLHHLYPSISVFRLAEGGKVLRSFCREHDIHYTNVTWSEGIATVQRHLRHMAELERAAYAERVVTHQEEVT